MVNAIPKNRLKTNTKARHEEIRCLKYNMPKQTRKVVRQLDHSERFYTALKTALEKHGDAEDMYLAHVEASVGGARFRVKDVLGETHVVNLSGTLTLKGKHFRNPKIQAAVAAGSWVIVDGATIHAVIGAGRAAELKALYKKKAATPVNEEDLFERAPTPRRSQASNASTRSSKNGKKARKTRKARS